MNIREQVHSKIRRLSTVSNDEFKILLDKYIKMIIKIFATSKQLKEELVEYDGVYQISITDIDFNCWFKLHRGNITYQKGKNEDSTIKFYIKKDLLLEIIQLKKGASHLYMKGLIKVEGDLSDALKFRKFLDISMKYVRYITKNQKNK